MVNTERSHETSWDSECIVSDRDTKLKGNKQLPVGNLAGSWINKGILKNKTPQCMVKHCYIIQYLKNKTTNTIN